MKQSMYIFGAAGVLVITGLAKIISAFGHSKLLNVLDPITGLKFNYLLLIVGLAEIFCACMCLFSKQKTLVLALLAWLSTIFMSYRLGLSWIGWKKPCNCLGSLTDALHIPPQTADTIMKGVLAYLLIGSYGLLLWHWSSRRRENRIAANPPERAAA